MKIVVRKGDKEITYDHPGEEVGLKYNRGDIELLINNIVTNFNTIN